MAENPIRFLKNPTRSGHFGWPPVMKQPHPVDQTPLQKRIIDSTTVVGHDVYCGPGDEFIDDKTLFRSIMSDPASWTVWFTDRNEIRALGVPDGKVWQDKDAEGQPIKTVMTVSVGGEVSQKEVWGVNGANLVLKDVTAEQKNLVDKIGGRVTAIQNVKSLEKNLAAAREEAAAKDAEIAALKAKLEAREAMENQPPPESGKKK